MDRTLEDITNQALLARGYIAFIGIVTDQRDEKGNNIIEWSYQRIRFSIDDAQQASHEFSKFVRNDMEGQYDEKP